MNVSYDGVVTAGGKPFSVPPGTNVSVEQARGYAVSYVLLHNGTEITVFPPSSFSSPFSITLYDVGNMSSMPAGTIVQYRQGAIQQFNFRNEFGN